MAEVIVRFRSFVAVAVGGCASALGAPGEEVPTCPPVTRDICNDLRQQIEAGRVELASTAATMDGEVAVKVPIVGAGLSASGSSQDSASYKRVTMSPDRLEALDRTIQACSAAANSPNTMTISGFWSEFGKALGNQTAYTCNASATIAMASSTTSLTTSPGKAPSGTASAKPNHLLLDLDLGIPLGVHVGYDFGHGHGVGARLGVGPAISSSSVVTGGVIAVFGAIGLDKEGRWRLEPAAGLVLGYSAGVGGGLDIHYQPPGKPDRNPAMPVVGARAGLNIGVTLSSSSAVIVPDAGLVLAW